MNPENIKSSIQAMVEGLTPLAQKLQVPVESLWGWALTHNYATALVNCIPLILMIVFIYPSIKFVKWAAGEEEEEEEVSAEGPIVFSVVVVGTLYMLLFLTSVHSLSKVIYRLVSPEYMTMKDIISLIGSIN